MTLLKGNCLELLKTLEDNSIDSIVTDPPYELGFMGKSWDASGIAYNVELWQQAIRVLKPGGHLLAFSGSRTYHRMAVAIEEAGFEIRDQIMWIYGSGFPKSLDVSKAIDKVNGEPDRLFKFTRWMRTTGLTARQLDEATGTNMGGHYLTTASQPAIPTAELWKKLRPLIADVPDWVDELVARIEAEREVVGVKPNAMSGWNMDGTTKFADRDITAPATPEAQRWQGWGTALKPAHEPIVVARKPLTGTVASNVLEWGTGALNIDGSRVGYGDGEVNFDRVQRQQHSDGSIEGAFGASALIGKEIATYKAGGRWPANVIHDGSEEVLEGFPNSKSGKPGVRSSDGFNSGVYGTGMGIKAGQDNGEYGDSGSAARFFYCAKASKAERNAGLEGFEPRKSDTRSDTAAGLWAQMEAPKANFHPTVKPIALMRYLVKLVTPPNGLVLDPFLGSGSTAVAAILEGFNWVGCEMTEDYWPIIEARASWAQRQQEGKLL